MFYHSGYDLFWWMLHTYLKMYSVKFCCFWMGYSINIKLVTCWQWYLNDTTNFYVIVLIFCSLLLWITEKRVWKSPTIIVDLLHIFSVFSFSYCFMYIEALLLGAHTFRYFLSSWWIDAFTSSLPCSKVYLIASHMGTSCILFVFYGLSFLILLILTYCSLYVCDG